MSCRIELITTWTGVRAPCPNPNPQQAKQQSVFVQVFRFVDSVARRFRLFQEQAEGRGVNEMCMGKEVMNVIVSVFFLLFLKFTARQES